MPCAIAGPTDPLPQELALVEQRDGRFLPNLGDNRQLHPTSQNIERRVAGITLCKDG